MGSESRFARRDSAGGAGSDAEVTMGKGGGGGGKGGGGGGKGGGGGGGKGGGGGGGGGKGGGGGGKGPGGWPSTTGNPSGGGRSNAPPSSPSK